MRVWGAISAIGVLLLAACGGGSGSSGGDSVDDNRIAAVSVELTGINSESIASNSFGFYQVDANGVPESGQIIWANSMTAEIGSVFLFEPQIPEEELGFFLITDGFGQNEGLMDGDAVTFETIDGVLRVVKEGEPLDSLFQGGIFGFAPAFFSDPAFNNDGVDHRIISGSEQGWEDLINNGDGSFNDIVINLTLSNDL